MSDSSPLPPSRPSRDISGLAPGGLRIKLCPPFRRDSQVVRQGSAKALFVGSIPTPASNFKLPKGNQLQKPEEEVPVKVPVESLLRQYSATTPEQLGNHWE